MMEGFTRTEIETSGARIVTARLGDRDRAPGLRVGRGGPVAGLEQELGDLGRLAAPRLPSQQHDVGRAHGLLLERFVG